MIVMNKKTGEGGWSMLSRMKEDPVSSFIKFLSEEGGALMVEEENPPRRARRIFNLSHDFYTIAK
jgi:hypothetical protein